VATTELRGTDEAISAKQFVERLFLRLRDMERSLADGEQLEIVEFLPSGKAISVDSMGYENPALVNLHGREQGTTKTCTLLAHQSSVQVLVSVEPVQSEETRRVLRFTHEK
jgi:hypothetical protein